MAHSLSRVIFSIDEAFAGVGCETTVRNTTRIDLREIMKGDALRFRATNVVCAMGLCQPSRTAKIFKRDHLAPLIGSDIKSADAGGSADAPGLGSCLALRDRGSRR